MQFVLGHVSGKTSNYSLLLMEDAQIGMLAIAGFLGFWHVLLTGIARFGGWGKLADRFVATVQPTDGKLYRAQSMNIGMTNYNGCIWMRVTARGLYLSVLFPFRPGHPPLLIPWHVITHVTEKKRLGFTTYVLDIGQPRITTLEIRKTLLERIEQRHQLHRKHSQKIG